MSKNKVIDAAFDDSPVDVSTEVNFIWSIANTLRGPYKSDKYKDVIIPMVIIRRFECALAGTKASSAMSVFASAAERIPSSLLCFVFCSRDVSISSVIPFIGLSYPFFVSFSNSF